MLPAPNNKHVGGSVQGSKHVTRACQEWRNAKATCDGDHPCSRCLKRQKRCVFTAAVDGRSQRTDTKRKFTELERENALLHDILTHIKNTNDGQVVKVLALMRSNASLTEVHECTRRHIEEERASGRELSPDLDDLNVRIISSMQQHDSSMRPAPPVRPRRVSELARLIDEPPVKVSASPWTRIIDDDSLTSHLVSLYFCWRSPMEMTVVQRDFVRDMQSCNLASTHCSRLLVNCILAYGCVFSDFAEARTRDGKISLLAQQFIDEASRLLEDEIDDATILTAQSLSLLFMLSAMSSEETKGYLLLKRAAKTCEDLATIVTPSSGSTYLAEADSMRQNMLENTSWAISNLAIAVATGYMKPSHSRLPPFPLRLFATNTKYKEPAWYCYPQLDLTPVPSRSEEVFQQTCSLQLLVHELLNTLFRGSELEEDHPNSIFRLHKRFQAWHAALPEHLGLSGSSTPAVITLHAWYHNACLSIGNALRKAKSPTRGLPMSEFDNIRLEAALKILEGCRLHQQAWGIDRRNVILAQTVISALQRFIEELPLHQYDNEISDCCILLRAMGRRVAFLIAVLRMLQVDAQARGTPLPAVTQDLFADFEASELKNFDQTSLESMYPAPAASSYRDLNGADHDDGRTTALNSATNMGDFLRMTQELTLNENDP